MMDGRGRARARDATTSWKVRLLLRHLPDHCFRCRGHHCHRRADPCHGVAAAADPRRLVPAFIDGVKPRSPKPRVAMLSQSSSLSPWMIGRQTRQEHPSQSAPTIRRGRHATDERGPYPGPRSACGWNTSAVARGHRKIRMSVHKIQMITRWPPCIHALNQDPNGACRPRPGVCPGRRPGCKRPFGGAEHRPTTGIPLSGRRQGSAGLPDRERQDDRHDPSDQCHQADPEQDQEGARMELEHPVGCRHPESEQN
jgi:hypothetical protein